ncbi:MAG: DUF4349 domain-containing protein [Gemmatimonadaceae bacterium]|nr:DUF4349 domain-containing protein [Gemmatimonadaceae bacterium]
MQRPTQYPTQPSTQRPSQPSKQRHTFYRVLPILLLLATALACGNDASTEGARTSADAAPFGKVGGADVRSESPAMPDAIRAAAPALASTPPSTAASASAQDAVGASAQTPGTQGPGTVATNMIIRSGNASLEVDSLELAIAAVQRIATSLGGWVGNTSLTSGDYQVRSATIELKIPAARYDDALNGLKPVGKIETIASEAQDVGEEFVDVSARASNSRRLEERLVTLLTTRTGKLEDVLAVERELARVREEIERYEGRLRFLRTRVATSTLLVTVHERAPLVSASPGENVLGNAFKDAWRNFVRFTAALIASLGTIIPILLLLAIAFLLWRRVRSRARTVKAP